MGFFMGKLRLKGGNRVLPIIRNQVPHYAIIQIRAPIHAAKLQHRRGVSGIFDLRATPVIELHQMLRFKPERNVAATLPLGFIPS
jgi:hypothetical protein